MQNEPLLNPRLLNPLNLAFLGDAVYEVYARAHILASGGRPVGELHKAAVRYVCAHGQSMAFDALCGALTEQEADILRRGRNCSSVHPPRSASMMEYRRATGVEALLGYLYLRGEQERVRELTALIFEAIERGDIPMEPAADAPLEETPAREDGHDGE